MAARPSSARHYMQPRAQAMVPRTPQGSGAASASRPVSAGIHRNPARPQSAQAITAMQRPGSAPSPRGAQAYQQECTLDINVGGMAGTLLATAQDVDPRLPPEMRLCQAALMRVAPCGRLLPCTSNYCCWRWAANKLLDEAVSSRSEAAALRVAFDEELGDSAQQALLNLQDKHAAVVDTLRATKREIEALERSAHAANERYKETEDARAELVDAYERAVRARDHADAAAAKAIGNDSSLREELASQKMLADEALRFQDRARKAEAKAKDVHQQIVEATAHLTSENQELRREKAELTQKLRQMEALEFSLVKKRSAARRAKHGFKK